MRIRGIGTKRILSDLSSTLQRPFADKVQESAKKLSDEFRSAVPELPWRELRALRNVIVHQYDEIEPFALYESATRDAAVLLTQLTPYVEAIED